MSNPQGLQKSIGGTPTGSHRSWTRNSPREIEALRAEMAVARLRTDLLVQQDLTTGKGDV